MRRVEVWLLELAAGDREREPCQVRACEYAGIWQSTPGTWRIAYDEWEYCRILEGTSILTEDGGAPFTVTAGDSFVIRPGFTGTWEVVETTRKDYVIRL
jgi:uncharacterized cupin superfamily protein